MPTIDDRVSASPTKNSKAPPTAGARWPGSVYPIMGWMPIAVLQPTMPQPYKNLGLVLFRQNGDRAEVGQYWQKYFDLNPNDPDIANMRLLLDDPRYRLK